MSTGAATSKESQQSSQGSPAVGDKTERASSKDWKTHEMLKPVTTAWNYDLPPDALPKLLAGFRPRDMDDRWFVFAEGPDEHGRAMIHFVRSWTGFHTIDVVAAARVDSKGQAALDHGARFVELIWESDPTRFSPESEEHLKDMVLRLCKNMLEINIQGLAEWREQ